MEGQPGWGTERSPPSMFEKRQHSKDTWSQSDVATFVLNQILGYSKHFVAVAMKCFLLREMPGGEAKKTLLAQALKSLTYVCKKEIQV